MKSDHLHWRTSSDIHQSWISNEFHWWGLLWDQKTSRGCLPITHASTSSTQISAEWCLSKKPSFRRSINIFSMKEIFNIMIYVPLKIMKVCEYCHILPYFMRFYCYPGYPFRHWNLPITASHGIPWRRFPAMGAPSRGSFRSCFVIAGPCFLSVDWFSDGFFTQKKGSTFDGKNRGLSWCPADFSMNFPKKTICWSWIEGKKGHQKG